MLDTYAKQIIPNMAVGLELEFEGTAAVVSADRLISHDLTDWWEAHTDGSLRPRDENTEFTFRAPVLGEDVADTVSGLCDLLQDYSEDAYKVSWRCGMHVHIDQRLATRDQIYLETVLSCFLDRVWFAWDGTGRQESKFCVPTAQIWEHMLATVPTWRGPQIDILRGYKYTGLNITRSLPPDIQTTEYRYAASSRDPRRILQYIAMCQWCTFILREIYITPDELIASFVSAGSYKEWFARIANPTMLGYWMEGCNRIIGEDRPTTGEFAAAIGLAKHYMGNQEE